MASARQNVKSGSRGTPLASGAAPRPAALSAGSSLPALAVRPGGSAQRFALALGRPHPVLTFVAALLAGFVALSVLSIAFGLFVVHVLIDALSLGGADEGVVEAFADERTGPLTDVSWVGSFVGGAPLLPILVGLVAFGFMIARRWLAAAFAVFVLAAESATYRVTTLFIHRDRPGVERLDELPLDDSFPSGHTAASIAVYSGLMFLFSSRLASSWSRALAWTLAILMTVFVALSRVYRGMHHPLDVAGGVIVGIGAVMVLLFACRAAAATVAARDQPASRA